MSWVLFMLDKPPSRMLSEDFVQGFVDWSTMAVLSVRRRNPWCVRRPCSTSDHCCLWPRCMETLPYKALLGTVCVQLQGACVCTKYQVSTDQLPYKALVVCVPIKYQLTTPEIAPLFNIGHQWIGLGLSALFATIHHYHSRSKSSVANNTFLSANKNFCLLLMLSQYCFNVVLF